MMFPRTRTKAGIQGYGDLGMPLTDTTIRNAKAKPSRYGLPIRTACRSRLALIHAEQSAEVLALQVSARWEGEHLRSWRVVPGPDW